MISRPTLVAAVAAALLGAATLNAVAQQPPAAAPKQGQPQRPYAYQLMTPDERDAYRKQMEAAQTPEERAKIRDAHRAEMQKRAQAQGITLEGRGGEPRIYGGELMTPEERNAYAEKMRNAKTQDERLKLRDEHRAEMQKRAKEKGVTLPEPRGPLAATGPGPGPGGQPGKGPTARRSQMYGDELFTPEERRAFFEQMKAAKTPEERAKLQAERRATAEARAKEKGIALPGPGGPGPGPGPGPGAPKAQ
jgi:hypothetical protein